MNDKIYICGICGKRYNTVTERNKCEQECIAKSEKAAAEKKAKETEAMKTAAAKKINDLINEAAELTGKYVEKYEEFPKLEIEKEFKTIRSATGLGKLVDNIWTLW